MTSFSVDVSVFERGRKRPEYSLNSDLNGEISLADFLEWTKQTLIITADEVLKEAQSQGFDKKPVVAVDGRTNKPILAVNPLGQIEFTSRANMKDILLETYDALLYRSKFLTGQYKESHYVFLNGRQVATDRRSLEVWINSNPEFKDSDTVRFVNITPYARKLERFGITAQRSKTSYGQGGKRRGRLRNRLVQIPNGAYALTARAIRAKYKRNSMIKFAFLPGTSMGLSGSFKGGRKGRNSRGRPYLYPSIMISVSERGLV